MGDKGLAHIREMLHRDMPEVLGIEDESFEFPWLEEEFVRCLRQRNCVSMVAEHEDRVVGFMIYELYKHRIDVLNFAVAADYCRRGVGSQMVAKLIAKLTPRRRSRIVLKVCETNLPAQQFFSAAGFRATGVVPNFYGNGEAAFEFKHVYDEGAKVIEAIMAGEPLPRITERREVQGTKGA